MILKVEDVLKPFSRTDPDCEAYRDLWVIFPAACPKGIPYGAAKRKNFIFIPQELCCEVVN